MEQQLSTFFVGDYFFGVDLLKVQEILHCERMTKVPLAASVISGLINLRGQIVTAIDFRKRLGLEERKENEKPMNVIISSEESPISLLVDKIGEIVNVAGKTLDPPPENLSENLRQLIQGVYQLDDRFLLVLDAQETINLVQDGAHSV